MIANDTHCPSSAPGKDAQVREGQERRIRGHFEEVHSLRDVAQEAAIAAVAILGSGGTW